MSINRMNQREREMHYLGTLLVRSIDSIADQDTPENIAHYEWLTNLMETTAAMHPELRADASRIKHHLHKPGIPF